MNFKQRLRRLERIAHDRLAAATAEVALSVRESPPLTEKEARRLELAELLRAIEVELHPAKVRESADFGRYYRNYRRVPLLKLYGYYLALKQRQSKIHLRRRKGTCPKGSIEYYRFLCRIYNERTEQASRLEREAMYAQREASRQDAAPIPATAPKAPPKPPPNSRLSPHNACKCNGPWPRSSKAPIAGRTLRRAQRAGKNERQPIARVPTRCRDTLRVPACGRDVRRSLSDGCRDLRGASVH